jgi:hypothetical protein
VVGALLAPERTPGACMKLFLFRAFDIVFAPLAQRLFSHHKIFHVIVLTCDTHHNFSIPLSAAQE